MAINKNIQKSFLLLIILALGLTFLAIHQNFPNVNVNFNKLEPTVEEIPQTSSPPLIDKVYTFLAPDDFLSFSDLYFEKNYNYYILVEMVTPHNCTLNVSLWDSDNFRYDLFSNSMTYEPQAWQSFEFPFGTVKAGNYSLLLSTESTLNFNLHIKIKQHVKCLYDIMSTQDINNLVHYRVTRFTDGMQIEHSLTLKTDMSYKLFIGRVSSISMLNSNEVQLDYEISDPFDISFQIYVNETMLAIGEVNKFDFGTSTEGIYTINITIYCAVEYVNIAYSIVEDYQISDVIDGNETDPANQTTPSGFFSLPLGWTTGLIVFGGIMIGTLIVLVNGRHKKRGTKISLDTN